MPRHAHHPSDTRRDLAARIGQPIGDLGSQFMLDGATYARGAELGFSGFDFYAAGRGGVLGAVDANVVVAAFTFIGPETIRASWANGLQVMDPHLAAAAFIECGYEWGRANLAADLPAERFVELVTRVTDAVEPFGVPLFAAWRAAPWPSDPPARALHAVHLLRELRGGYHAVAVLANGVDPHAAVVSKSGPVVAEFLGWSAPHPEVDEHPVHEALRAAEDATNLLMAHDLAVLTDDEVEELASIAATLRA
ncbi:MAG: SCO6745 family protein [Actinomycetes bacterium]